MAGGGLIWLWRNTGAPIVRAIVGGGRVDGALDKRAMDEVILRRRRAKALKTRRAIIYAYGAGMMR